MSNLHFLCVADVNDINVGASCVVDINAVRALVRDAANQTGMGFHVSEFVGETFDAEALTSALHEFEACDDDVVVCYYTGHGARGESKRDAWPVLSLGSTVPPFDVVDLGWVYQTLHEKGAGLLLMFVDCCQQIVPDDMLRHRSFEALPQVRSSMSAYNYTQLFREFRGEVLLMSCKPGQLSGYSDAGGGFFTATLLDALRSAVDGVAPADWDTIARRGSEPPRPDQQPIWQVVPEPTMRDTSAPGMEPFPGPWNIVEVVSTKLVGGPAASRGGPDMVSRLLQQQQERFTTTQKALDERLARINARLPKR